jgi:hypothetical protein
MIIRNYPNKLVALFLVCDPVYDWLVSSSWNPAFVGIKITDAYLLIVLGLFGLFIAIKGIRWILTDLFLMLGVLYLITRLIVDASYGLFSSIDYLPREILNLSIYALATKVRPEATNWSRLARWSLFVYLVAAIPQLGQSIIGVNRITSIFGNPNFLAFNVLNMLVLLALFPRVVAKDRIWGGIGLVLLLLTKTRSVLLASLWFVGRVVKRKRNLVIVALGVALLSLFAADFLRLNQSLGTANLNGRVQIWRAIAIKINQMNLVFGSGTNVASRLEIIPFYDHETGRIMGFTQPQNHYIWVVLETGFVGLLLWTAQIAWYLRSLSRLPQDRVNQLTRSFIYALLTIQLAENGMFANPTVLLIMGLAVAHGRSQAARDAVAHAAPEHREGDSPRTLIPEGAS